MNKTHAAARHRVASRSKNRPNMWCVIDSTLNTAYTPARRRVDRHTGPAESGNPEVLRLHS